jgi:Putative Actinobacterial Holin-X, holin superfamily III
MTVVDADLRRQSSVQLVKDLTQQASTLVHQELELVKLELAENAELARAELLDKGRKASAGAAALAGAGLAAMLALGTLTACLVLALDGAMPAWGAALVVGALWVLVAVPLALYGRRRITEIGGPVPRKTVQSVKEDVKWLSDQMS